MPELVKQYTAYKTRLKSYVWFVFDTDTHVVVLCTSLTVYSSEWHAKDHTYFNGNVYTLIDRTS